MIGKPGTSLYYTVKKLILERINDGIYPVGGQLPSESSLCSEFEVSRTTVRQALQHLEQKGIIYKVQGKGSFVKQSKIHETQSNKIKSFSEQMKRIGIRSHSKVLTTEIIPANLFLAHSLDVNPNDLLIKLVRLRYAEHRPYQLSTSYIPRYLAPDLLDNDCSGSLFELLKVKYNLTILKSVESIEPVNPNSEVCSLLEVSKYTASFLSESITYSDNLLPIEYSSTIVRGDYAKFITERFY